jgi:CDP-2,3-bis-(O-geranylgeranyl)-sn-glycerol synthase
MACCHRATMPILSTALSHVLRLLYFMAPAYVANMAPPFVRYWKGWNRPISRRWLGEHKTVIGFGTGVAAAVMVTFIQSRVAWPGALIAYDHWATLGLRFGVGAMAGDSAKSFVKRRLGIAAGEPWMPWDQLDFVLGALALVWSRAALSWADLATILLVSFAGHVLVNHLGYWMGIRDVRW